MVWYWFKDHTSFRTRDAKGRFDMIWHMFCSQTVLYISWYLNLLTPAYSSVLTHQLYLKNMKTVHFHFLLVDRSWPVTGLSHRGLRDWAIFPPAASIAIALTMAHLMVVTLWFFSDESRCKTLGESNNQSMQTEVGWWHLSLVLKKMHVSHNWLLHNQQSNEDTIKQAVRWPIHS